MNRENQEVENEERYLKIIKDKVREMRDIEWHWSKKDKKINLNDSLKWGFRDREKCVTDIKWHWVNTNIGKEGKKRFKRW